MTETKNPILSAQKMSVINVGVELFAEALQQQQVDVVHVEWTPPAQGNDELIGLLDSLI